MFWFTSRAIVLGLLLLSIGCSHNHRRTCCGQTYTLPSISTADASRFGNSPLPPSELNSNTTYRNLPLAAIPPIPGSSE